MLQALPSSVGHLAGASSVSSAQFYFCVSCCSFLKSSASANVDPLCCTFYVLWQRHISIKATGSTEVPRGEASLGSPPQLSSSPSSTLYVSIILPLPGGRMSSSGLLHDRAFSLWMVGRSGWTEGLCCACVVFETRSCHTVGWPEAQETSTWLPLPRNGIKGLCRHVWFMPLFDLIVHPFTRLNSLPWGGCIRVYDYVQK